MAIAVTLLGSGPALDKAYSAVIASFSKVYPYQTCPGGLVASGVCAFSSFGPFPGVQVRVATIPDVVEDIEEPESLSSISAHSYTDDHAVSDVPDDAPYLTVGRTPYEGAITLRFSNAAPAVLVTEAQRVSVSLAGIVSFSEPPTSWQGNVWCVHCSGSADAMYSVVSGMGLDCDVNLD